MPVPSRPFVGDFWKAGIPAARVHAPPVTVYTLSLLARTRSVTPGLTASSTRIRAFDSDSSSPLDSLVGQNVGCALPAHIHRFSEDITGAAAMCEHEM